jgi:hypothetical protein
MLGEQFTVLGDHSISPWGDIHSALGVLISDRGAVHSAHNRYAAPIISIVFSQGHLWIL